MRLFSQRHPRLLVVEYQQPQARAKEPVETHLLSYSVLETRWQNVSGSIVRSSFIA